MKINSITTQDLDSNGQVVAVSKTVFNKGNEPLVEYGKNVHDRVIDGIKNHTRTYDDAVKRHIVTVSTNKGKFVKTYKSGFGDKKEE